MTDTGRFHVATRKGLFRIERSGGRWRITQACFEGDNVPMMLADERDGALYATVSLGHWGTKLHRSRDDGATWQEIPAPKYPPKPEGEVDIDPIRGQEVLWNLDLIWSLESGGAQKPGRLWCGTVPGGLFRSDDHGDSWSLVRSLWDRPERKKWSGGGLDRAGIHSIWVDPRDADHLLLAVSCGGVWRTRDAGESFTLEGKGLRNDYLPPDQALDPLPQDVHRLSVCRDQPDTAWVQHHNGIFRSSDNGATFTELKAANPSVFGFVVAAHPQDARTAWFVPAIKDERRYPVDRKVVVMRTRDGGRTFEPRGQGLPSEFAYDLVYRHALDVDHAGQTLAFGSTTGNLWVSDDGGDSFQNLTTFLPPIYAVRYSQRRI
jgi:ligand-binding sensor domain-containing protein